jgi:hypothetical protein
LQSNLLPTSLQLSTCPPDAGFPMTNPDLLAAFGERYVRGYAEDGLDVEAFFELQGLGGHCATQLNATDIQLPIRGVRSA